TFPGLRMQADDRRVLGRRHVPGAGPVGDWTFGLEQGGDVIGGEDGRVTSAHGGDGRRDFCLAEWCAASKWPSVRLGGNAGAYRGWTQSAREAWRDGTFLRPACPTDDGAADPDPVHLRTIDDHDARGDCRGAAAGVASRRACREHAV